MRLALDATDSNWIQEKFEVTAIVWDVAKLGRSLRRLRLTHPAALLFWVLPSELPFVPQDKRHSKWVLLVGSGDGELLANLGSHLGSEYFDGT